MDRRSPSVGKEKEKGRCFLLYGFELTAARLTAAHSRLLHSSCGKLAVSRKMPIRNF